MRDIPEGLRFGLYTRISQDRGEANGRESSIDRQDTQLRELISDYLGTIVGEWSDPDRSAYRRRVFRPDFAAMLDAAARGELDAIGVVAIDRLTRQPREIEKLIDIVEATLKGRRVLLVTDADDVFDLSDPDDLQRLRERGVQAAAESARISRRVRRTTRRLARGGAPHSGGRRPYGHERVTPDDAPAYLAAVKEEAGVIREVTARVVSGETMRAVAALLNDRGVPTVMGKQWSGSSVRSLLEQPRLAGLRLYQGELYSANGDGGGIEPILKRAEWDQLQAVLRSPAHTRREVRTAKHLLTGLLRCGECGGRMGIGYAQHRRRHYQCQAKSGPAGRGCVAVSAEPVEAFISDAWAARINDRKFAEHLKGRDDRIDPDEAQEKRHAIHARMDAARHDHYVTGDLTKGQLTDIMRTLQAMDDELQRAARRDPRAERLEQLRGNAEAEWAQASAEERRVLLSLAIDHITIAKRGRGPGTFDTSRVAITWRSA